MRIFELTAPFVTPRDIELPPVDNYGMYHGQSYSALDEARFARNSTRTVSSGLKFDRRFEALSTNEMRIITALQFHPYVVDVREQYGTCDDDALNRALSRGERMRRLQMTTIDVIVTYVLPGIKALHYHSVSIKPAGHVPDQADERREEKEENFMAQLGWTWELVRGDAITLQRHINNLVLLSYVHQTDIHAWYEAAGIFSKRLLRSRTDGMAVDVMERVGKRAGVSLDDSFRLFSTAVAFGFLRIDHSKPFAADRRLVLDDDSVKPQSQMFGSNTTNPITTWGWL
ncbi:TnsA endonuclease N-terminal domain-containing protein [Cupriavidus metallidurans]|uniref:TnsA endonuclease N-terminal domain-containing protein n=1 Tax=Cupriavidus metallidurans TaxID=119219 RepID=UPI001BFC27D5|nr:TnsA endonuclease N-terminal domain-containing protein [Cupriavidus metallidurans]QWC88823.1 hypothetical protein KB891_01040 [Cupriavidus metallidurans]